MKINLPKVEDIAERFTPPPQMKLQPLMPVRPLHFKTDRVFKWQKAAEIAEKICADIEKQN